MTTVFETRQDSLTSLTDGNTPPQALLRMGIQAQASIWDLFALQGRMFNFKQTTIGTVEVPADANAAGIVLTAPTFRFTVPTGLTVFPRRLNISTLVVATALDNELALVYTDTDTFTSATGSTTLTPLNWRSDAPRASGVENCVVFAAGDLVEAALTNVRALYQACWPLDMTFGTSYNSDITTLKVFDDLHPIIGPASVILYMAGKTEEQTFYFSMDWAEIPTESAITAV